MITNTNMSIFNKSTDSNKKVIFKKHLLENVFWNSTHKDTLSSGHEKANSVSVFIPKNKNDLKNLLSPKEFKNTKNINAWTLKKGDFIVKGDTSENEVLTLKELTDKYDEVFTIMSVSNKDFGSPHMHHFQITGE